VGVPQASVAVAVPKARSMAEAEGLQPMVKLFPEVVMAGPVLSAVHVAVLDAVEVLPQASMAVNVLVCERSQPELDMLLLVNETVGVPQASVAVAVPKARSIAEAEGLQPRVRLFPEVVIVGVVLSSAHVAVRDAVDVLPHASIAVNVLVCERPQPVLETLPLEKETVGVPQASVAVAVPNARSIAEAEGLQPRVKLFPEVAMVGAVTSAVHVAVLDAVEVLPHASMAVNVLVCERSQPELDMLLLVNETVGVPQASVAVAVPKARSIAATEGLQPKVKLFPEVVMVGAVTSAVHVAVLNAVEVLPQASRAVNVLVCDRSQPVLETLPFEKETVGVPHPSVAVAVPNARSIAEAEGLQPRVKLFPEVVMVGPVISAVHVAVRNAVEVLPQASMAVNVLVCDRPQPVFETLPFEKETVGVPQASVAVAVPNARSIAEAEGLQPRVRLFPEVVMAGPVLSAVHVAVRNAVKVLPQASIAVNVLVCDRPQPVLETLPFEKETVGVPQASVAVAVPNARSIAEAEGLQPRVKLFPEVVMVGGMLSVML
jgi:hypothetical protein